MNLIEEAKLLISQKPDVNPLILKLKDKSISLDERWKAFSELDDADLLPNKRYGNGMTNLLRINNSSEEITMYDNFFTERGERVSYISMYEMMLGQFGMGDMNITDESLQNWQEAVLAEGYGSFTYDW